MDSDDEEFAAMRASAQMLIDHRVRDYLEIAGRVGLTIERLDPVFHPGAEFVWESPEGVEIHILEMLFNTRLSIVDGHLSYGFHWCFSGRGRGGFTTALLALRAWQGDLRTQPRGFIKNLRGEKDLTGIDAATLVELCGRPYPDLLPFELRTIDAHLEHARQVTADPFNRRVSGAA